MLYPSKSEGTSTPSSARREACAKSAAILFSITAVWTMSLSALKADDMYCSASPFVAAALMANCLSACKSSLACLKASGSLTRALRMKAASPVSEDDAPFTADPARPALVTSRTKLPSARRDSAAPAMAPPLIAAALVTNSLSALSDAPAFPSAAPLSCTASRTKDLSPGKSPVAYCNASPRLSAIAMLMVSRSPHTSSGALSKTRQSIMMAEVHEAKRQLLLLSVMSPTAFLFSAGTPCFWADVVMPAKRAAFTAMSLDSSSNGAFFFFSLRLLMAAFMLSSSLLGKSLFRFRSFRSLSPLFSLNMSDSCADARRNKAWMSKRVAPSKRSKSLSLSTFTKVASHLLAPHSTRLSLSSGVRISPHGVSLWCFMKSITLFMSSFPTGIGISAATPFAMTVFLTMLDTQAASAETSKMSPLEPLSLTTEPSSDFGHPPVAVKRKWPKTSKSAPQPAIPRSRGAARCQ
mmetsp:Transcript_133139/g.284604  ORF Transcript_133139/g.284604 Transcript_133139/m.284604 type:complete len:465 (-) Transcript_133139:30-1424(-)